MVTRITQKEYQTIRRRQTSYHLDKGVIIFVVEGKPNRYFKADSHREVFEYKRSLSVSAKKQSRLL